MAAATDNFMEVAVAGSETTIASPGHTSGGTSINITSASGWPTTTGTIFAMRRVDSSGNYVAGTYTEWAGVLSGTAISGMVLLYGSDQTYAADGLTQVYIPLSKSLWNRLVDTLLVQHKQDGTHTGLTTDTLTTSAAATLASVIMQSWDGWVYDTHTWVYVSTTSFKITGVNLTALFPTGTKIKVTQGGIPAYFYVTGAAFSTDTTITVNAGSDYSLSNTSITSPAYSYATSPQSFPGWFNYTPTLAGLTSVGAGSIPARFSMQGKTVSAQCKVNLGTGFSWTPATGVVIGLPVQSASAFDVSEGTFGNSNAWFAHASVNMFPGVVIWSTDTTISFRFHRYNSTAGADEAPSGTNVTSTTPFTWIANDWLQWAAVYQAA